MAKLSMWFSEYEGVSLDQTSFKHPLLQSEQRTVRGKSAGALQGYFAFQWTPAVQALSLLMLNSARLALQPEAEQYLLLGTHATPAASLDYALSKEPAWLLDMFGVDSHGRAIAKRLFKRSNPERKRPGPVILALNCNLLRSQEITIYRNDQVVTDPAQLTHLANCVEAQWRVKALVERVAPAGKAKRAPKIVLDGGLLRAA